MRGLKAPSFPLALLSVLMLACTEGEEPSRATAGFGSRRPHILNNQEVLATSGAKHEQHRLFVLIAKLAEKTFAETRDLEAAVAQLRAGFQLCPNCKYDDFSGVQFREAFSIDSLGDRLYLTQSIFPAILEEQKQRNTHLKLLWAGCHPYTLRYEYLLKGVEMTTIDPNPAVAVYGSSRRHITDILQNIGSYSQPGEFDLAVVNGVIGWGINTDSEIESFVKSVHLALKPGGALIVGFNRHMTPCCNFGASFSPSTFQNLPRQKDFDGEWQHTYEVYRRP